MKKNRSVSEWLQLWGDFENYGGGINLGSKSNMQTIQVVIVQEFDPDAPLPPNITEEEEKWLLDSMAIVKRRQNEFYRNLQLKYVHGFSDRRLAAVRKITPRKAETLIAEASGYCKHLFEERLV